MCTGMRSSTKHKQTTSGYTPKELSTANSSSARDGICEALPSLCWNCGWLRMYWTQRCGKFRSAMATSHPQGSSSRHSSPPSCFYILTALSSWRDALCALGGVGEDLDIEVPPTGSGYGHLLSSLWPQTSILMEGISMDIARSGVVLFYFFLMICSGRSKHFSSTIFFLLKDNSLYDLPVYWSQGRWTVWVRSQETWIWG